MGMRSSMKSDDEILTRPSELRFLSPVELKALKFAICQSEGLSIEECEERVHVMNHFRARESNFMMYHTGEESICLAWVLGDEMSFISDFVHEELHRVLHKRIDLESCDRYDNVANYAENVIVDLVAFVPKPKKPS